MRRPLVMVVDDDEGVREAMCDVLELEGYEPLPRDRPDLALASLAFGAMPAVIIVDIALPGIGGAGFIQTLRSASAPWSRCPILVVSAWKDLERHGLAVEGVLTKPADPVTLARAVDRLALRSLGRSLIPSKRRAGVP